MPALLAQPQVLLDGLGFPESPRWHDGRLWACNWGLAEIVAVDPSGQSEVMLTVPTSLPFSIDWLPDGRLLVILGRESRLMRQEADGSLVLHADLAGLCAGCNEIVVDGRGNTYVNGGAFGGGPGAIVLVPAQGAPRVVAEGFEFPNGMAVTADNATLIIAESHGNRLTGFDIAAGGGLSGRRVWAELDGFPDGICLDAEGCAWYADVPGQCCVRVREGGEVVGRVELDRGGFACMLGGDDGRTLFITAAEWRGMDKMFGGPKTGQVLAVRAPVAGAGWP